MRRVGGWGATLIAAPSWSWQWYVCLSVTVAVPACACMTSLLRCSACVSYANTRVWRNKQAQANSAGCLLFMGAAAQALKMARHAVASLERSMPLTGRGKSTGMAWEAHGQVDQGLRAILHAAQVAHSPWALHASAHACVSHCLCSSLACSPRSSPSACTIYLNLNARTLVPVDTDVCTCAHTWTHR